MKLRKLLLLGITILLVGLIAPAIATASDTALSSQSKTADETSNRLHDLESRAKALEGKTDRMITQADDIQRKQQQLETDQAKKTWQMSTWWIIAPLFVSAQHGAAASAGKLDSPLAWSEERAARPP